MNLFNVVRKQVAFIRRGFLIESSYKAAFAMDIASSLVPLFSFYFLAQLFGNSSPEVLRRYGGDYFGFVLVGVGLTQFFSRALDVFSANIRRAQLSGVLESIITSRTSPVAVVLYDSTFSFIVASLHLLAVFVVGAGFLGADFSKANYATLTVSALLALGAFVALGVFAAASIVVLKKGNPVAFFFGAGASLFSGAYFPVEILPKPVQFVSELLPMTHALEALRLSLFTGAGFETIAKPLVILGSVTCFGVPGSLLAFHLAVEKGRREGTLLEY